MLNQFLQLGECVREISGGDPLEILELVKNHTVSNYPVLALEINLDKNELSLQYIPLNSDNKEVVKIHEYLTKYYLRYSIGSGKGRMNRVDQFLTIDRDFKISGKHISNDILPKDLEGYDKKIKTKITNFFKEKVIKSSEAFEYLVNIFPEGSREAITTISGSNKSIKLFENQSLLTSEIFEIIKNNLVKSNINKDVQFIYSLVYYFVKDGEVIYPFNIPEIENMIIDFTSVSPNKADEKPCTEGACVICGSTENLYDKFPNMPFSFYESSCPSTAHFTNKTKDYSNVFLACEKCAKTIKYGQMIIRFNPNFQAKFKLDDGGSYLTYVFPSSYKVNKKLKDRVKTIATSEEGKKELLTKAELQSSETLRQNILIVYESNASKKIVTYLQDIPNGKFAKIKSSLHYNPEDDENKTIQGLGGKIIGYAKYLCKENKDNLFGVNFFIKVQKAIYLNEKLSLKELKKYLKDIPIDNSEQMIYVSQLHSFIKFMRELEILEFEDIVEFKELGRYVEGLSKVANHTKGIWSHFPYRNSSKQKLTIWIHRVYESLENLSSSVNKQLPNFTSEGINKITNSLLKANDSEINLIILNILFGRSLAVKMNGGK